MLARLATASLQLPTLAGSPSETTGEVCSALTAASKPGIDRNSGKTTGSIGRPSYSKPKGRRDCANAR
jgi:hypothetical protein